MAIPPIKHPVWYEERTFSQQEWDAWTERLKQLGLAAREAALFRVQTLHTGSNDYSHGPSLADKIIELKPAKSDQQVAHERAVKLLGPKRGRWK